MGNLHLVTGYAGQAHITAEDHGSLNAALLGSGHYVLERGNKFSASAITSNQIRVLDGDLLIQGRHVRMPENTYVDLAIDSGAQGVKRNDLIVARYTKNSGTGVEDCNLVVIKGTAVSGNPVDPEYVSGDILGNHDVQVDFPLYRIPIDGLTVGTLVQLFSVVKVVTTNDDGKIDDSLLPSQDWELEYYPNFELAYGIADSEVPSGTIIVNGSGRFCNVSGRILGVTIGSETTNEIGVYVKGIPEAQYMEWDLFNIMAYNVDEQTYSYGIAFIRESNAEKTLFVMRLTDGTNFKAGTEYRISISGAYLAK